jgi:hypothetical protein
LAVVDVAPNPFNPTTTIRFDLPRSARVEIVIYDARGRAVETVLDEDRVAGRHRIQWNARGHASGVYYCALRAEGRTVRAKLTIVQ